MSYWQGAYRWINVGLLAVLGVLTVDGVLRLFGARAENLIVRAVRVLADPLRAPFAGMFNDQPGALTFLFAVVGYIALALVIFAVMRTLEASRAAGRPDEHSRVEGS